MVGWFEAVDYWGENVALTRSRHLIDGSLSVDSFLCRVDGSDQPWVNFGLPGCKKIVGDILCLIQADPARCSVSSEICVARQFPFQLADGPRPYL